MIGFIERGFQDVIDYLFINNYIKLTDDIKCRICNSNYKIFNKWIVKCTEYKNLNFLKIDKIIINIAINIDH